MRLTPDAYRELLVRHRGTKVLEVVRDDMHFSSPENPWADVVADFARKLHNEIGDHAKSFVCEFSTTGSVERTASLPKCSAWLESSAMAARLIHGACR